jgi:hypothetical protein
LREIDAHVDIRDRAAVTFERREPVAQPDRETPIETYARIGVRLLAGPELALQVVELAAHVDQRLHAKRRPRTDTADAHRDLTFSSTRRAFP